MANSDRYRRDEQYGREDRGFVDRATDEVRSWFGDEDAEARRRREQRDAERGDMPRPQGRSWQERGRAWPDRESYEDRREQRMFPELANTGGERMADRRGSEEYGTSGWDRSGDRGGPRREPWPEDRGDTTPRHGTGPAGGWREWGGGAGTGQQQGGWHVGKGPKGYTRSDERIREDVCDRLTDDPYVDATNVEVTVQGGEVTLSGVVERREDKRRAEDIAERISGVREVSNRLRVGAAPISSTGPGTPAIPTRS